MNAGSSPTKPGSIFLLYLLIALFILAPYLKIANYELPYFVSFLILPILFLLNRAGIRGNKYFHLIFGFPSVLVLLSLISKWLLHGSIDSGDLNKASKYLSYVVLFYASIVVVGDLAQDQVIIVVKRFYYLMMMSLFAVSFIGVVQYAFPSSFQSIFEVYSVELTDYVYTQETNFSYSYGLNRMNSIFLTPIVFGGFLTLGILTVVLMRKEFIKSNKVFFNLTLALGLISLGLSNARAAIVALLAGVFFMFLEKRRIAFRYLFLVGGVVYVLYQQVLVSDSDNLGRIDEIARFVLSGFDAHYLPLNAVTRLNDIAYVWERIINSGFVLTGVTNAFFLEYFANTTVSYNNQFFAWFVEFGVFGILISVWLFYLPYFFFKHSKNARDPVAKVLLKTLSVIFIAEIIMGITQTNVFGRRWREFIFVFMGLIWVYYKKSGETDVA